MRSALALVVFLAACGGKSKPAPAAPPPEEEHVAVENTVEEEPAPEPAPVDFSRFGTGSPECDELIGRTTCAYDKAGADMPAEARKAFEDSLGAWRDALANESTRQATIDACKMSLDAARDGFAAQGC